MIPLTDLAQAMKAAPTQTTDAEIQAAWEQMTLALEQRRSSLEWQLRERWVQENGRQPEALT